MCLSVLRVGSEHECFGPCLAIAAGRRRVSPKLDSREESLDVPKAILCENTPTPDTTRYWTKPGSG